MNKQLHVSCKHSLSCKHLDLERGIEYVWYDPINDELFLSFLNPDCPAQQKYRHTCWINSDKGLYTKATYVGKYS